ncbi:MAG: sugar transferase [Actinomycetota bacterium]
MAVASAEASPRNSSLSAATVGNETAVGLLVAADVAAMTAAIARFGRITPNTVALVALAVLALALGDHYRLRLEISILDDMAGIAGRVVLAISLGAAYRELVSGHDVFTADRLWVLVGAATFVVLGRALAYTLIKSLRYLRLLGRRTIVIASQETTRQVVEALNANPASGLVPFGPGVDLAPIDHPRRQPLSPVDLTGAETAIVEVTDTTRDEVTGLLRRLPPSGPEVYLLPAALMHYPAAVPGAEQIDSLPLVAVRPAANRSLRWKLKRIIDVLLASILLPLAAPVIAIGALGLYLESGSGVLYRQVRVGRGGRLFTMYKLRTIVNDSPATGDAWQVDAGHIRPFAQFCRTTAIDELPQLWNVLLGDMSLVGPRPERPIYARQFAESIPDYDNRHRVPVGLTGLSQVRGLRGDTSISARSRVDNSYIDNWSLLEDLKILCRTVFSMITLRGWRS